MFRLSLSTVAMVFCFKYCFAVPEMVNGKLPMVSVSINSFLLNINRVRKSFCWRAKGLSCCSPSKRYINPLGFGTMVAKNKHSFKFKSAGLFWK